MLLLLLLHGVQGALGALVKPPALQRAATPSPRHTAVLVGWQRLTQTSPFQVGFPSPSREEAERPSPTAVTSGQPCRAQTSPTRPVGSPTRTHGAGRRLAFPPRGATSCISSFSATSPGGSSTFPGLDHSWPSPNQTDFCFPAGLPPACSLPAWVLQPLHPARA